MKNINEKDLRSKKNSIGVERKSRMHNLKTQGT